jgi:hypothetical protein
VKALITTVRSAFPDLNNTIIRQFAEGDWVVNHTRVTGTMKGDFMGMKATGKSATWETVHIVRIQGGKIVEHSSVQDLLGMLQQVLLRRLLRPPRRPDPQQMFRSSTRRPPRAVGDGRRTLPSLV